MSDSLEDKLDRMELTPGMEPLTPDEKEAFLARVRAQGRSLTSAEQYALFGPPPAPATGEAAYEDVPEMEPAQLAEEDVRALQANFFHDVDNTLPGAPDLVAGVILDFDYTLAIPGRPLTDLMEAGARQADAYMRSTGMDLPEDFYHNIIEARLFAAEKSDEEVEEHVADDAMSFLLQFFGYPASIMDPAVLHRAVDLFYAPEMTAWQLRPGARELLAELRATGLRLALLANYSCDRVFQRTIDYLKIRDYFDLCLTSASVEYRKPDTQFFNLALERWDLLPHEIVVVGDSLAHDCRGGIELGALTVHVAMETSAQIAHQNEQLAGKVKPDATVSDLQQIPALIRHWATP